MNKTKLLTAACLLVSLVSFSQPAKRQYNNHSQVVKLGVNTFFDGDEFPFSISWEKKVGANQSIQVGFLPRYRSYDGDKTSGVGVNFAYRKYISRNRTGINGLFISPIAKIGFLKDNNSYNYTYYYGAPPQVVSGENSDNIAQFSAGLVFGHNWVYRSGFSFELSGGIAYYNTRNKNSSVSNGVQSNYNYRHAGLLPQLQLSLGYAF